MTKLHFRNFKLIPNSYFFESSQIFLTNVFRFFINLFNLKKFEKIKKKDLLCCIFRIDVLNKIFPIDVLSLIHFI